VDRVGQAILWRESRPIGREAFDPSGIPTAQNPACGMLHVPFLKRGSRRARPDGRHDLCEQVIFSRLPVAIFPGTRARWGFQYTLPGLFQSLAMGR
jgi:hypothetical protein